MRNNKVNIMIKLQGQKVDNCYDAHLCSVKLNENIFNNFVCCEPNEKCEIKVKKNLGLDIVNKSYALMKNLH